MCFSNTFDRQDINSIECGCASIHKFACHSTIAPRIECSFYLHWLLHDHRSHCKRDHKRYAGPPGALRWNLTMEMSQSRTTAVCIYKNFSGVHLCSDSFEASDCSRVTGLSTCIAARSPRLYGSYATRRHAIHLTVLVSGKSMRKFDKFKLSQLTVVSHSVRFFSRCSSLSLNFVQMAEFSTPTNVKCRINNSEFCTPVKTSVSSIQIPASPFLEKIGYGTGMFIYFKCIFF